MQPRLEHFIVRPGTEDGMPGPIVPLIAVDQLPDWMQVAGVPRELDAEQTIGLTNLGIVEIEQDSTFEVRLHHDKIRAILDCADEPTDPCPPGKGKATAKATKSKRTASPCTASPCETKDKTESLPTLPGDSTNMGLPHAVERSLPRGRSIGHMLSASRHNIANTAVDARAVSRSSRSHERPLRPHVTEATRDESRRTTAKQDRQPATASCRYWCHHGTCKWGPQCCYVHRMPTTVEGLRELGLKDFPPWYLRRVRDTDSKLPGPSGMGAFLGGLGGAQVPSQQHIPARQPLVHHHGPDPPSLDHGQLQGRLSAPLAPDSPVGKRQKLKQIREMRDLVLSGTHATHGVQQARPHMNSNYASLPTNATVAANAASIQRQAERQHQPRDNMRVVTRVRASARSSVKDGRDGGGDELGELVPASKVGRASNDHTGVMHVRSPGFAAGRASSGEDKLVDID